MKSESIAYGIAGVAFGLIAGWIIGTQQAAPARRAGARAGRRRARGRAAQAPARAPPILDEAKVTALKSVAEQPALERPAARRARQSLFRRRAVRRCDHVVPGGAEAHAQRREPQHRSGRLLLLHEPGGQGAPAARSHSLSIDPKHAKTLLNIGIVKAFGKQDLEGATKAWQQVVELSPDSPKGRPPSARSTRCDRRTRRPARTEARRLTVFRLVAVRDPLDFRRPGVLATG